MTRSSSSPLIVLRSALFAVAMATLTVVWALVSLLTFPLPYHARFYVISRWCVMVGWLLRVVVGLDYTLEGRENIPDTPCIVLSKHESAWETIILPTIFAPQTWVLKRELLWLPFFGWGLAMLAPIAINRNAGKNALQQVIEQGRDRLDRGAWVVVFPEGTRVAPGSRKRYKPGGANLAAKTGTPVLPVAHDSGDFWGRNSFLKYPGTIRLVVGPLVHTEGLTADQVNRQAQAWIESTVERLRDGSHGSG